MAPTIAKDSKVQDKDGRYILIDAIIQDSPLLLLNIYSPNNAAEQSAFFSGILNTWEEATHGWSRQLIIGRQHRRENKSGKTQLKI